MKQIRFKQRTTMILIVMLFLSNCTGGSEERLKVEPVPLKSVVDSLCKADQIIFSPAQKWLAIDFNLIETSCLFAQRNVCSKIQRESHITPTSANTIEWISEDYVQYPDGKQFSLLKAEERKKNDHMPNDVIENKIRNSVENVEWIDHIQNRAGFLGSIFQVGLEGKLYVYWNEKIYPLETNTAYAGKYSLMETVDNNLLINSNNVIIEILPNDETHDVWKVRGEVKPVPILSIDNEKAIGWISTNQFFLAPNDYPDDLNEFILREIKRLHKDNEILWPNKLTIGARKKVTLFEGVDIGLQPLRQLTNYNSSSNYTRKIKCDSRSQAHVRFSLIDIGNSDRPLPALLKKSDQRNKNLLVYLRGGPASTVLLKNSLSKMELLYGGSFDILAVDYSGSIGVSKDIRNRLRSDLDLALDSDRDAILGSLEEPQFKDYRNVVLHAGSFSTLLGLDLISQSPNLFSGAVITVPWIQVDTLQELKKRPNKTMFSGAGNWASFISNYEASIKMSLGIDFTYSSDPFRDWMRQKRENFESNVPTIVLLAENENRSDNKKSRDFFSNHKNVSIVEVSLAIHEGILAMPQTADEIRVFLQKHLIN